MTPTATELPSCARAALGPSAERRAWLDALSERVADGGSLSTEEFTAVGTALAGEGVTTDQGDGRGRGVLAGLGRRGWVSAQLQAAVAARILSALAQLDRAVLVLPGSLTTAATAGDSTAWTYGPLELAIAPADIAAVSAALDVMGARSEQPVAPFLDDRARYQPFRWLELDGVSVIVRWPGATAPKDGAADPATGILDLASVLSRAVELRVGSCTLPSLDEPARLAWCARRLTVAPPEEQVRLAIDASLALRGVPADLRASLLRSLVDDAAAEVGDAASNTVVRGLDLLAAAVTDPDVSELASGVRAGLARRRAEEAEREAAETARAEAAAAASRPPAAPRRAAPLHLVAVLVRYRRAAHRAQQPATVRGLLRWLSARWGLGSSRQLPSEALRRIAQRRPADGRRRP